MNRSLALLGLLAATPAAAEPCDVVIEHAPDEARVLVERWVGNEQHCNTRLVVRIVETSDGLYVYARDVRGRVRERTVPRAQDAAVLVASWAAADTNDNGEITVELGDTPAPPPNDTRVELGDTPAPSATSVELGDTPAVTAPGMTPRDAGVARRFTLRPRPRADTSLALHGLTNATTEGVRSELDAWARGPWRVGATLSVSRQAFRHYEVRAVEDFEYLDIRALAQGAMVGELGNWQMRWGVGAGLLASYLTGQTMFTFEPDTRTDGYVRVLGVSPTVEASFALGRRIGRAWLVQAGPLVTVYGQTFHARTTMGATEIEPRGGELLVFAGARRSL